MDTGQPGPHLLPDPITQVLCPSCPFCGPPRFPNPSSLLTFSPGVSRSELSPFPCLTLAPHRNWDPLSASLTSSPDPLGWTPRKCPRTRC